MSLIVRAAVLANQLHQGQVRKYTNMPYINHPGRVAARVTRLGMDEEAVAAAWLHDTVEDCGISTTDLKAHGMPLGTCLLVHELTNPSKKMDRRRRDVRKAIDRTHASQASTEARMIKLADRIDNLRELDPKDDFAKLYLMETTDLLGVLNGTHKELEAELLDVCHALAKSIEAHRDDNTTKMNRSLTCDITVSDWLTKTMGGGPEYLNDYNPDHFRVVADMLPLFDIVGGAWKAVSDRMKQRLAAKAAAQST